MFCPKEKLLELTREIYRLTLLFPKKEPLRYKIREIADEILAKCLNSEIRHNPVLYDLEILDSFLEIVKDQNWVSPKEILEIKEEYVKLREKLKNKDVRTKEIQERKKTISSKSTPSKKIDLNKRQEKILEILKEKEKIQVWQIKEIFPDVSKRTLRRDFHDLFIRGLIERIGDKNNTYYKLK